MMDLRLLITGGRDRACRELLDGTLQKVLTVHGIACIAHGATPGGDGYDWMADQWGAERGIRVVCYPVNVSVDGPWPGAGVRRNQRMLDSFQPDAFVAFPGGSGTRDMAQRCKKAGVRQLDLVQRLPFLGGLFA